MPCHEEKPSVHGCPQDGNAAGDPAMPSRLLDYGSVAEILGVSPRTVYTLCKSGRLPAVRVMGSVRIDPRDLERFINEAKGGEG
jgi:excisionase family DNA binding protein